MHLLDLLISLLTHHSWSLLLVFLLFFSSGLRLLHIPPSLRRYRAPASLFLLGFCYSLFFFFRQSPILQIPCIHISFVSSYTPSLIMDRHLLFSFPWFSFLQRNDTLSGYLIVLFFSTSSVLLSCVIAVVWNRG